MKRPDGCFFYEKNNMNIQLDYDNYKQHLAADPDYPAFYQKIQRIVTERQLVSAMSDAKWVSLQHAMRAWKSPPAYHAQLIIGHDITADLQRFMQETPAYLGDWNPVFEEGMPYFINIEFLMIKPMLRKFQGALMDDEIYDQSDYFRTTLQKLNIPFEEENHCFTVYGYRSI